MSRTCRFLVIAITLSLPLACGSERASDEDRKYDVVVRDVPDEQAAESDTAAEVDRDDTNTSTDLNAPPPTQDLPPTLDQPPQTEQPQEAVGWVSVSTTDGIPYEVWQDGRMRGRASLRLTQRPGDGEYAVRDESGQILCRGHVGVRQYESVCLECDVRTGKFRRGTC
jgi:hypothetical protein